MDGIGELGFEAVGQGAVFIEAGNARR
jgi:hypothetical protein